MVLGGAWPGEGLLTGGVGTRRAAPVGAGPEVRGRGLVGKLE